MTLNVGPPGTTPIGWSRRPSTAYGCQTRELMEHFDETDRLSSVLPPLSSLRRCRYATIATAQGRNPVAYDLAERAINLPSALISRTQVDRVCDLFSYSGTGRGGPIMKAVILAGGRGTRISEESQSRPKPMVEIGGRPILWHIMKIYGAAGITEFIVLLGYKGYMIKEYFANYFLHMSDITIDLATDKVEVHQSNSRAVEGHAARHRPGDDDRRTAAAGQATTSATRTSASPTATASPTSMSATVAAPRRQ